MLIKSKIRREGGSRIDIDGVNYHFKPEGKSPEHVCEVEDKEHIARFLAISEGYELAEEAPKPDAAEGSGDSEADDEPSDYLVTSEAGDEVDLGKMSRSELLAFAEKEQISLPKKLASKGSSKAAVLEALFAACTKE